MKFQTTTPITKIANDSRQHKSNVLTVKIGLLVLDVKDCTSPGKRVAVGGREVEEEGRVDAKAEWRLETDEYVETGGLRWSTPLGFVANFSWPFAKVRISPTRIRLTAKFWKIYDVSFVFEKAELQALLKRNGLINTGLQFQHQKANYPSLLIFWTLSPEVLFAELQRMGYDVSEAAE